MEILLKFIFIVIVIYYALRLFLRYGLPWLINRFLKRQQEKFNNMSGFGDSVVDEKADGEVYIKTDRDKRSKKSNDSDFGEYVEFEDIEE